MRAPTNLDGTPRVSQRLFPRLLVTVLAAFVPFAVVMAAVLTQRASDGITDAVRAGVSTSASALADRVDTYLTNRRRDVEQLAADLSVRPGSREQAQARLRDLDRVRQAYDAVELLRPDGTVVASSRDRRAVAAAGSDWLAAAASGDAVIGAPVRQGDRIVMVVAAPVPPTGRTRMIVVGDLDVTRFHQFAVASRVGGAGDVVLVDPQQRKLLAVADGVSRTERALLQRGALRERVETEAAARSTAGKEGAIDRVVVDGREYVSGYAPVSAVGWGALVRADRDGALAAVDDQRRLAVLLVLVGILIAAVLAYLFARQASQPLVRLAGAARSVAAGDLRTRVDERGAAEVQQLSVSFNAMVESLTQLVGRIEATSADLSAASTQLSSAAEELAATTQQQSAAATETSATMEELARTFASISETVTGVATQTGETRDALERAEQGLQVSSERTLRLAQRVHEISGLLELINEISDQTNLLALNAAIEAARAGEAGRGFTVVADEVRRLAESSKSRAAEIATIVEGTQDETNATVMAMENSANLMRTGLELMDHVAEATEQVRLTTQQQNAAAAQVVETMESVTETSRQTSSTAQQIAASAGQLIELTDRLRAAAAEVEAGRAAG